MNRERMIKMLEYCGMSYNNYQPESPGEQLIFINDKKTDVQCFLRIRNDTLIITFRGSDSKKDWKANFKFWETMIPYNNFSYNIKVHSGFISTYKSPNVRGKIHGSIDENIKNIYVTGHSYGAALAILCAVDLRHNFPQKNYEIIVFGSPRVGNNAFKKFYNLKLFKTIRIETKRDIIPQVPFAFLGYRHVGARIRIGRGGILRPFSLREHTLQKYYSYIWDV